MSYPIPNLSLVELSRTLEGTGIVLLGAIAVGLGVGVGIWAGVAIWSKVMSWKLREAKRPVER